ncbi:MAG: RdgB/HAM1 family non-canonical purine NTP pyrophosphatase [Bacilli bacterium]
MKPIDIVIATNNPNKVREYKELFENYNVNVTSLKEEGIISSPEEGGTTFEDNALIKARDARKFTSKIVIADDSGICIHALDNFPGVYSARFMEEHSYQEKNLKINEMLADKEDKSASYHCAIAFVSDEEEKVFVGSCEGVIVPPVEGPYGFGYDPIFYFKPYKKTFSCTMPEDKNNVSHRGKATVLLMDYLEQKLEKIEKIK